MKSILIYLIQCYKKYFRAHFLLTCCKYAPSCSEYAIDAIKKRGAAIGTLKACWRILRCNPFSKGGYDPIK